MICQLESGCYSLSSLRLHVVILPGFRSGISQQCSGACLPKTALNRQALYKAHIAAIYSCLDVFAVCIRTDFCLSAFSFLAPSLVFLPPSVKSTHFIPIFTSVSGGCRPLIVSQTGTGERERDRQGWAQPSQEEEVTLSYRCPHPSSE